MKKKPKNLVQQSISGFAARQILICLYIGYVVFLI